MQAGINRAERARLLERIAVEDISHFGRPLSAHLMGTYDLLAKWQNPHEVCMAGLFHSVYGTKTFLPAALSTDARTQLRSLIGELAENLVFVFAMSDRKRLLLENANPPYFWINHRSGERLEITGSFFDQLVEIEVANFIEQMPFLDNLSCGVIDDMRERFRNTVSHMSEGAKRAFLRTLGLKPTSGQD